MLPAYSYHVICNPLSCAPAFRFFSFFAFGKSLLFTLAYRDITGTSLERVFYIVACMAQARAGGV